MENKPSLGQISYTLDFILKVCYPDFIPYSAEVETFYEKYWDIFKQLSDKQLNLAKALCFKNESQELKKLLSEWKEKYAKN